MTKVVTSAEELKTRLKPFEKEKFVTVDTEFIREKSFYAQLCLIQIAGEKDEFCIDPLAKGMDLAPFYKLMANKKVVKVFHSCSQDVEIFVHDDGNVPQNLFDTQVAAQILGYGESISYGNLVKELTGDDIDKGIRHSDWSARPLSKEQIDYALSDVTHLWQVYLKLTQELKEKGREKWLAQEMEHHLDPATYENNPKDAWKRIKLRSRKKEYVKLVASLARWREERAQKIDKPRNWVMKSDALLEIAQINPREPEDLMGTRFFDFKRYPDLVDEILVAARRGRRMLTTPKVEKKAPMPKGAGPLMDLLKVLLRAQSDHHNVAPSVVAKISDLEEIARETSPNCICMKGWRYEVFGKYAMQLKKGKLALTAHNSKIVLIEPAMEK